MAEKNYGNNSQLAELVKYISDEMKFPIMGAGGGYAPIGTINFFDATVAPLGWLACDGSTYNISDYPDLATYYASVHGASNFYGGNGTTTFTVPDWREVCLVGAGENTTLSISDHDVYSVSQFKDDQLQTHEHYGIVNTPGGYNISNGSRGSTTTGNAISPARTGTTTHGKQVGALICVKATLSDTELDNMHIYSPNEHQVGWWQEVQSGVLKQKPVWEKVVTAKAVTGWDTFVTITDAEKIIDARGTIVLVNDANVNYLPIPYFGSSSAYCIFGVKNKKIVMSSTWTTTGNIVTLNVKFTKTTDQWQTV